MTAADAATEVFVSRQDDLTEGVRKVVEVTDDEVVVFAHDGQLYAFSNWCLHMGGPVGEGVLIPKVEAVIAENKTFKGERFCPEEMHMVCPWHGWEYDIRTGEFAGDRSKVLRSYETVVRDGDVYVLV